MELVDRYPNVLGKGFFGRLRVDILQALLGLENIAVQTGNQRIELGLQVFRRCAIRFNGQVLVLEATIGEMLQIGFWLPCQHVLDHVRHVGNHFDQHDHFVEMIQIVGCQ